MEKEKIKYLEKKIGFHFKDLSATTQAEIKARPESYEWKLIALSHDTPQKLEVYGTRMWNGIDFQKQITAELEAIEKMPIEDFIEKPPTHATQFDDLKNCVDEVDARALNYFIKQRNAFEWIDNNRVRLIYSSSGKERIVSVCGGRDAFTKYTPTPEVVKTKIMSKVDAFFEKMEEE